MKPTSKKKMQLASEILGCPVEFWNEDEDNVDTTIRPTDPKIVKAWKQFFDFPDEPKRRPKKGRRKR